MNMRAIGLAALCLVSSPIMAMGKNGRDSGLRRRDRATRNLQSDGDKWTVKLMLSRNLNFRPWRMMERLISFM